MRAWGIAAALTLFFVGAMAAGCTSTPAATCSPACGTTMTCCDSASGPHCQSTLVDPHNCGGCGIDCAGGTCALGHCMPAGPDSGLHLDGGRDAAVIGDCHPSCASGLQCCGTTCVSSTGVVSSATSTTDPSFTNCHVCGTPCDATSASHCGLPHGTTSGTPQCLCGDLPPCLGGFQCQLNAGSYSCINMMTDPRHCGDPPVSCMSGETCVAGACTCMAAGARCPTDQLCTSTGCVDTMTDFNNCGTVGNVCHAGENCSGGMCLCGTSPRCMAGGIMGCGQTCCGGTCVFVDDYNCGGCGMACAGGMVCGHGAFGGMSHCGVDGAGFFIACDAPTDAAPGPDAGTVDAGVDDGGLDGSTDDAGMDAGNDAFM